VTVGKSALIFAEDPGAAHYVAGFPRALREVGIRTVVYAAGLALEYLGRRGVCVSEVDGTASAEKLLSSVQPQVLVVGTAENPDTLSLRLVRASQAAGIPSVGVVDALMNADRRFRGRSADPLAYAPDRLILSDDATMQEFALLGLAGERMIVCGHPHYDFVRERALEMANEGRKSVRGRLHPRAADDRKIIVFAAENDPPQSSTKGRPEGYALSGSKQHYSRTEIVLDEFLDAAKSLDPQPFLILRPHPKDAPRRYDAYRDEFDGIRTGGSPLGLIYSADLVVGMTSMLLMEAALMGRPTLSIIPRACEKTWLPTITMGVTPYATTQCEIREQLDVLLAKSSEAAGVIPAELVPCGALERAVSYIEKLVEEGIE